MSFIAIPGQTLSVPEGYLRGHGTYLSTTDGELHSSVAGTIERVNKLVSVRPFKSRYTGNVGDVIVGRITEVGNKRWKVDVNARQEAVLLLGSINLPGGAQRRRTLEDRLQMRQLFAENDVISCEITSFYASGGMNVQTRSMKYGKLENGQMVIVPPSLVKRVKRHFVSLRCGVDVVLGHNGYIWLTSTKSSKRKKDKDDENEDMDDDGEEEEEDGSDGDNVVEDIEQSRIVHLMESRQSDHAQRIITAEERLRLARAANAVTILADAMLLIMPMTIEVVYDCSLTVAAKPSDMLIPSVSQKILQAASIKF